MTGGLLQLAAIGAQDVYLTGKPDITFFKNVYKRYSNFSIESKELVFIGGASLGQRLECVISKSGDLLKDLYLEVELPTIKQLNVTSEGTSSYVGYVNDVAIVLLEYMEIQIGGETIDKHYTEWLDIWAELNMKESKKKIYNEMTGHYNTRSALQVNAISTNTKNDNTRYYIPLRFWFNRNPGLAIPLISLQYHDVKLIVKFRKPEEIVISDKNVTNLYDTEGNPLDMTRCVVWADYIYLDTHERRQFAQKSHEYLIEQTQYTSKSITNGVDITHIDLHFNHPINYLVWVMQPNAYITTDAINGNRFLEYTSSDGDSFESATVQLSGKNRFSPRTADYFRLMQPYQHFDRGPSKYIYVYSFAIDPTGYQPSGTCNFSRLDEPKLTLTFNRNHVMYDNERTFKVFGVNYNILRIMSGMGGLAFSN